MFKLPKSGSWSINSCFKCLNTSRSNLLMRFLETEFGKFFLDTEKQTLRLTEVLESSPIVLNLINKGWLNTDSDDWKSSSICLEDLSLKDFGKVFFRPMAGKRVRVKFILICFRLRQIVCSALWLFYEPKFYGHFCLPFWYESHAYLISFFWKVEMSVS